MNNILKPVLQDLVLANRILANEDVLDAFGHISVRHPENNDAFLLSCSRSPALVKTKDIMTFDLDANVIEGEGKPYLERVLHAAIYQARPDVMCVVHHHALSVLPFAVADKPLVPVFHLGAVAGEVVPVWDSRQEFGDTSLLVSEMNMAKSLARTLGSGPTALLRHHGAVCVANNLAQATFVAICMRDNAELLLRAHSLGKVDKLTSGEIELVAAKHDGGTPVDRAWEYWRTRLPQQKI